MMFPRKGDPVLYDDGWDFTSLMQFMRQVAHMSSTDTGSTIKHSRYYLYSRYWRILAAA